MRARGHSALIFTKRGRQAVSTYSCLNDKNGLAVSFATPPLYISWSDSEARELNTYILILKKYISAVYTVCNKNPVISKTPRIHPLMSEMPLSKNMNA